MDASVIEIENVIIPVLGLCIIMALAIATLMEENRDYSRKLFIYMLTSCSIILLLEMVQLVWDDTGGSSRNAMFMEITMFLFYALLSVICYCWTVYAYYWFNGHKARGKVAAVFMVAPLCEIIALLTNFYTDSIYSVDAVLGYSRGSGFMFYMSFSYLFLIIAIIVTAIAAGMSNKDLSKRDFYMFILCFLFPVVGPLLQYEFSEFSLMGVSESIALLIVYMSIQQRTTARYAAERAQSQVEYAQYEETLERLLSAGSKALYVFRINISKDTRSSESGISDKIAAACEDDSIDALCDSLAAEIRDPSEARAFRGLFDRKMLIENFSKQNKELTLKYYRMDEDGESHLVRVMLSMLKNPVSGDIEAIVYSEDIDRQEKEERVIKSIVNREYDYIALINKVNKKIAYVYSAEDESLSNGLENVAYDDAIKEFADRVSDIEKPGDEHGKFSYDTILKELNKSGEYSYVFNYESHDKQKLQKRITCQYLDEQKNYIIVLFRDITEASRLEREHSVALRTALLKSQHADAMKTEFLSNLSHDMRTPLNAVIGYAVLAEKTVVETEKNDYISKIHQAGRIMLELVNDTLDLSKIESGEIILRPVQTSYKEIEEKLITAAMPQIEEKHIDFVLDDKEAAKVEIIVDPLRIHEIIMNLVSNAIKFTSEKGRVAVSIKCLKIDEKTVHDQITISDNGCGMKEEFIPKMFEPFSQERQNEDTPGSGLGLSIVKRLVDLMGGTIEIASAVGRGTTCVLQLSFPRAEEKSQPDKKAEEDHFDFTGKHVLLVEDNAMNIEIGRTVLESRGIIVSEAKNGMIALEKFEASEPGTYDAIIMDIRMPVMNGREAAKCIRKSKHADAGSIPIIAMSADAFDDDIRASLDAGMNRHIAKPLAPEQLFKCLEEELK